jgi:hypothetical protein
LAPRRARESRRISEVWIRLVVGWHGVGLVALATLRHGRGRLALAVGLSDMSS